MCYAQYALKDVNCGEDLCGVSEGHCTGVSWRNLQWDGRPAVGMGILPVLNRQAVPRGGTDWPGSESGVTNDRQSRVLRGTVNTLQHTSLQASRSIMIFIQSSSSNSLVGGWLAEVVAWTTETRYAFDEKIPVDENDSR